MKHLKMLIMLVVLLVIAAVLNELIVCDNGYKTSEQVSVAK